jgi:hypothetical protein
MTEARVPRDEIGRKLLPANMQFKLRSLIDASRQWSDAELQGAFAALGRADRRIKRGADAETALAAAIVEACGGGERPGPDGGGDRPRPSPRRGR